MKALSLGLNSPIIPNYISFKKPLTNDNGEDPISTEVLTPVLQTISPFIPSNSNQYRNKIWSQKFDLAFTTGDVSHFLNYVNAKSRLKPLFLPTSTSDIRQQSSLEDKTNKDFPVTSLSLTALSKPNDIKITAGKSGHIQIRNQALGELFVEKPDLNNVNMDEINKDIISGGARGFDPFDQKDWQKVLGREWPTAEDTRDKNGVAKLSFDKSGKGILIDTPSSVGQAYKTRPRAMALLDSEHNSVILAFQQENNNPDIDFGAWSILPFKIREGKKTLAVFPIEKRTANKYNNSSNTETEEIRESEQWNIDKSNKFFIIDASKPSDKSEHIDPDADWCMFATEGDDTVCLVRSCYKDSTEEKQFKAFSGKEENGGTRYIELEFIAPKVKTGKKSTIVYRMDFIPLKKMGLPELTEQNLNETMEKAANVINDEVDRMRKTSNLSESYFSE